MKKIFLNLSQIPKVIKIPRILFLALSIACQGIPVNLNMEEAGAQAAIMTGEIPSYSERGISGQDINLQNIRIFRKQDIITSVVGSKGTVTDPALLKELTRQGINKDYVELFQDYAPASLGQERSPYAQFYRDIKSGKHFMVVQGLPMVTAGGQRIEPVWNKISATKFRSGINLFLAEVDGNNVKLIVENNQPDGRKKGDKLFFNAQLFLNGVEQKAKGPTLLATDPANENYHNNVLEWDYGFAKRRMRIIEGHFLGSWVFSRNPDGDIRIVYNQVGDYHLKLGRYAAGPDEERVSAAAFDTAKYPFEVSDSAIYYPNANPESTSVDGIVERSVVGATWASYITASSGTSVNDTGSGAWFPCIQADSTGWNWLNRGFFIFDTSGLADNASISAATFSIYGGGPGGLTKYDPHSWIPDLNVYSVATASNTSLATADYNYTNFGSTAFSTTISFAGWNDNAYNNFVLNSSGIANISKTGVSKFGVRNVNHDVSNSSPAWTANWNSLIGTLFSEYGSGYQPKLVITYTIAPYTFTPCGQTGTTGPTQAQCNTAYGGFPSVTVTSGIQYWTVPATGNYTITAYGAQGGSGSGSSLAGGKGAKIQGDFLLTAGTQLKIVVGQIGGSNGGAHGNENGGGGGTFVTYTNNTPLIVAGGGGGGPSTSYGTSCARTASQGDGQTGTSGVTISCYSTGAGGTGGAGGSTGGSYQGGAGGGLTGNGANGGTHCVLAYGGLSFTNGATGGTGNSCYTTLNFGGFGGGGGGQLGGPGAGGGYSGGGSSGYWSSYSSYGGGGGSYNGGTSASNTSGSKTGNGQVEISGPICTTPLNGGDFTVYGNCSYSGIDGIDNGNLTISSTGSLILQDGAIFAFNSGRSITIQSGGAIVGEGTGQIKKTNLWMGTGRSDQLAQDSSPGGSYVRRYLWTQPLFSGSSIATGNDETLVQGWLGGGKTGTLLFDSATDGWATSTFHSKCDNQGPTLSLVRVNNQVVGGYNPNSWTSTAGYQAGSGGFLFNLTHDYKLNIVTTTYQSYNNASYGPTFGGGHDFCMTTSGNMQSGGYNNPHSYQNPSTYGYTYLADIYTWPTPAEMEVYKIQ